jgi:hypothetical protein
MAPLVNPLYALAEVRQGSQNMAPILSPGSLMIPVLCTFETTCRHYFMNKEIAANDQVRQILYNFKSAAVQSWVLTEEDHLAMLSFKVFMIEFKLKFLTCSWEDKLIQDQISFQSTTPLLTWINKVHNANDELHATSLSYYIAPTNLQKHLVPCLAPALKHLYNSNNGIPPGATLGMLNAITTLEEWQKHMHLLKQDLDLHHSQWVAEAKKGKTAIDGPLPTQMMTMMTASSSNSYNTPLPHLTNDKKALLSKYLGCSKCLTFYAGHISPTCKVGQYSLEACKNITPEHAAKAKAAWEKKQVSMHVAMVFEESDEKDYFDDCIEEGEGDEYMPHPFFFPKHLKWTCCINTPFTCAPTPVSMLIDHGSPPVLISSELIKILGLIPKPLFKPFSVYGAFMKEKRNPDSKLLLSQYCKLHIQSPNTVWKSKAINTIICPQLHTDLILSLDFLLKNHIVVDANLCTVINKSMGYNLLNPPDPTLNRKQSRVSPHKQHKAECQAIALGQQQSRKM